MRKNRQYLVVGLLIGIFLGRLWSAGHVGALAANLQSAENEALTWQLAAMNLQDQVAMLENRDKPTFEVMVAAYTPDEVGSEIRLGTAVVSSDLQRAGLTKGTKIYIEGYGLFIVDQIIEDPSPSSSCLKLCTKDVPASMLTQRPRPARVVKLG